MQQPDIYLYSPLSNEKITEGEGRCLLLQFILTELFLCMDADKKDEPLKFIFSTPAYFFPFDWSFEVGCFNKIEEHSRQLPYAFPKMSQEVDDFQTILEAILIEAEDRKKQSLKIPHQELMNVLSELYEKLIPFVITCKESENLVLFLLKHAKEIGSLSKSSGVTYLLSQMYPDRSFEEIRNRYDLRGFSTERAEFDALIAPYERQ